VLSFIAIMLSHCQ